MLQLLCFVCVGFFSKLKVFSSPHLEIMLFSLKLPYKIDGMFHTNRFMVDTLKLPEL